MPKPTEDDPKRGVDYLESIVNGYEKEKLKRAAISGLLESVKGKKEPQKENSKKISGILCRTRTEDGEILETESPKEEDVGIGFSFIIEMARAKVAINDLDDRTRHIVSALYTGLTIGHKKTTAGLPLTYTASETGFDLQ